MDDVLTNGTESLPRDTPLQRFLVTMAETAMSSKENLCRRRPTDMWPLIVGVRAGQPVAIIGVNKYTMEKVIDRCHLVATGMEVDMLGIAFETWARTWPVGEENLHPLTGKPMKPGDAEVLAREHDAVAKGWVKEMINVGVVNRAGDILFYGRVYHYVGGYLVWTDRDDINWSEAREVGSSGITDMLATIMLSPVGSVLNPEHEFIRDFTQEQRDADIIKYLGYLGDEAVGADDMHRLNRHSERDWNRFRRANLSDDELN